MKTVIACGASGGHIFPGIALAEELKVSGKNELLIVTSDKPLDIEILKRSGFSYEVLSRNPFTRSINPFKFISFLARLAGGVVVSLKIFKRYRPDCVVGFGGFVSGPVIFAAWLLRIPRIIHEQNLVAGLANRVESVFANKIAVSFDDTKRFFNAAKVVKVGNPVRTTFQIHDQGSSRERFGLNKDRFTIAVMGGSQGASFLNRTVVAALALMDYEDKKNLQVIHITGETEYGHVKERYAKENIKSKTFPFLSDIDRAYTAADLVIARSGATTIAELTYFGKPSILVPYAKKSVHQAENAYFLSRRNAAITVEEKDLSDEGMKGLILELLRDTTRLDEVAGNARRLGCPEAVRLLADEVLLTGALNVKK